MTIRTRVTAAVGVVAILGCETGTAPSRADPPGTYQAISLQLGVFDNRYDVHGPGGTLTLSLVDNGALTGQLHLPAPWSPFWDDSSAYDLSLLGVWEEIGPGIVLHTFTPSFFSGATLRRNTDTLWMRLITDEDPYGTLYLDAVLVRP